MAATERPPLRGPSVDTRVLAVEDGVGRERNDRIAGEEPLEIRVAGLRQSATRVAVTMRTPGHDFELAAGFLHSEGLLSSPLELSEIKYCTDVELGEQAYNVVTVHLRRPFESELVQRNFGVTSACGVCGKSSIDAIEVASEPLPEGPVVAARAIQELPERLRAAQRTFDRTGGSHAAGTSQPTARSCSCVRTSAATTRSTRSSATACSPAHYRSQIPSRSFRAAPRSSSCRRPRWPASRCCAPSAHPRAWPWMPRAGSA